LAPVSIQAEYGIQRIKNAGFAKLSSLSFYPLRHGIYIRYNSGIFQDLSQRAGPVMGLTVFEMVLEVAFIENHLGIS